jgi:hypothetical protein
MVGFSVSFGQSHAEKKRTVRGKAEEEDKYGCPGGKKR